MAMRKVCDVCGKILIGGNDSFVLTEWLDLNDPAVFVNMNEPIFKFDACQNCLARIVGTISSMTSFKD